MWRSRKIPVQSIDPNPPNASRYEMTPVEWLKLEQDAGGDAIVGTHHPSARRPACPDHLERAMHAARTLRLALRKVAMTQDYLDGLAAVDQFFTIVNTRLSRAPWEEED